MPSDDESGNEEQVITIAELRSRRGIFKGQLTRFQTYLDKPIGQFNVRELKYRLSRIEEIFQKFEETQTKLEFLDNSESLNRVDIEESFYEIITRAGNLIDSLSQVQSPANQNSNLQPVDPLSSLKLPPMQLPVFSGNYEFWLTFRDTFANLIHNNVALSNIQKFYYLRSCLKGDALRLIESLEISATNYEVAWDSLNERYENKRIIVNNHVNALFNLPNISKESGILLRQLNDQVFHHVNALKKLNLPVDTWDLLLIHIVTNKLDNNTRKEWENSLDNCILPTFEQLRKFLNKKCFTLETLGNEISASNQKTQSHSSYSKSNKKYEHCLTSTISTETCILCNNDKHFIYACQKFLGLSLKEKHDFVRKFRLCSNCLRSGHFKQNCRSGGCKKCNSRHNTLLHSDRVSNQINTINSPNKNINSQTSLNSHSVSQVNSSVDFQENLTPQRTKEIDHLTAATNDMLEPTSSKVLNITDSKNENIVLLSTAQVFIFDAYGFRHTCRALLDTGSQSNLMTTRLRNKLNLNCQNINFSVAGVNGKLTNISERCFATVSSRYDNSFKTDLSFLIIDEITGKIPSVDFSKECQFLRTLQITNLADPDFGFSREIDILLGADIFYDLLLPNQIKLKENLPKLQETVLGWIVTGSITIKRPTEHVSFCNLITNEELHGSLTKFWEIENIPDKRILSEEEQMCEDYFAKTTTRNNDGRFIVRLPFSRFVTDLGDSRSLALKRLQCLERKFTRNSEMKNDYTLFMNDYERLNHMTCIKELSLEEPVVQPAYFLPHHAVFKLTSTTTKCRVVFDGSCRTNKEFSLNDFLAVGPVVQDELFYILLRLRLFSYVLSADIKMMFRQILIHEDDRIFQQILWRNNENENVRVYTLNTVTYGTACAPYLSTRVLQQLSFDFEHKFSRTCKIIRNSFYMDDLLLSVETIEEAIQIYSEITEILNSAGFQLRKWCSNSMNILEKILKQNSNDNSDKLVEYHENKNFKTLGISWDASNDSLSYCIDAAVSSTEIVYTKRIILAKISKIFDPLGLIGPAIIRAKIFIQKLWLLKLGWDEPIPEELSDTCKGLLAELHQLNEIKISRQVLCKNAKVIELFGFCDSSEKAYGACCYMISSNDLGEKSSNILCAKSKVAPHKKLTLPRLELLGAVLLARLTHNVLRSLNIHISRVVYFCDSTIVLSWIRIDPSHLKTFVANRVEKIRSLTNIDQWKHIPSELNPADIISRGIRPAELDKNNLWWHGPSFMLESNDFVSTPERVDDIPEIKSSVSLIVSERLSKSDLRILDKYSSLSKLVRVVGYMKRFVLRSLNKVAISDVNLSVEEFEQSMNLLVRLAQSEQFSEELFSLRNSRKLKSRSKILNLHPFLDNAGILRVGGRLKHSHLDFDQMHPIILPKNHRLTTLVIMNEHLKHLHAGPQNLLSIIRLKFWPIDGKTTVKRVLRSCIVCFRNNPKPAGFLMGDLPPSRIFPCRPFLRCGVDYIGPVLIKGGSIRKPQIIKTYICVFVCLVTRAVHLDLASDLSTECFLNILKRFVSRRGKPSEIYSDNGSNFIGANNHFKEFYNFFSNKTNQDIFHKFLAQDKICWKFIPARSAHMGGLWEAAVKSAKYHIKRIVGNASLRFEEMYTCLTQIEACLNSRPLSPLSDDPNDLLPLTPSHFLIGDSLAAIPQKNVQETPTNRLSRYHQLQRLHQHFWTRWSTEYLTQLQRRSKWKTQPDLHVKEGALVILIEDNLAPLHWPMARIVQVHPGVDGVVRVVSVRVANGKVLKRALTKICILPMDTNSETNNA